jgi:hypothetical protein
MKLEALQYIQNTGGIVSIKNFDEDHEPIGPSLRNDLWKNELIEHSMGGTMISLSSKGRIAVHAMQKPESQK